jgi:hypothetical protein
MTTSPPFVSCTIQNIISRQKHIDVPYHVIREYQENRNLDITYISTQQQLVDMFTKALPPARFFSLREQLGVHQPS